MILGIIPARQNSRRLPGKNTRMLCGKPLIAWTIEAALTCGALDEVLVSSDDPAVRDIAEQWGVYAPGRPDFLATDTASIYDVVRYHLKHGMRADHVMLLQPTSPLRTAEDIDTFVQLALLEPAPVHSCALGELKANGAIYLAAMADWRNRDFNFDTTAHRIYMDPARSIDINTLEDFEAAERYMREHGWA